jgi:hypothetical protein
MNQIQNSTAFLTFIRHGEKDDEGKLTLRGFGQARDRGLRLPLINGEIILFHSGVGRVKDTVRTAAAHLHLDETSEAHLELGEHIVDYVAPGLHFLAVPSNKGNYHNVWESAERTTEAVDNRMRDFLHLNDISPEPGVWLSPKRMAQNVALMIGVEVRFADMTASPVTFVNGTHEPIIMSFLHYLLHDFNPGDTDTVGELGGSVGYAEGFEIYVEDKDQHNSRVKLRFRTIEYSVDLDALRAFAYS